MKKGRGSSERGFTLPELMIVIVIMGILAAVAIPSWFGILESRRVTSATNQLAADLRLAHSSATNRLGTASISFDDVATDGLDVTCDGASGVDYCLIRPLATGVAAVPRTLPEGIVISSRNLTGGSVANTSGKITGADRTVYLDNSGSARVSGTGSAPIAMASCPSGNPPSDIATIVVASQDGDPRQCIAINAATSKVSID